MPQKDDYFGSRTARHALFEDEVFQTKIASNLKKRKHLEIETSLFTINGHFDVNDSLHSFDAKVNSSFCVSNDTYDNDIKNFIKEINLLSIELGNWINNKD